MKNNWAGAHYLGSQADYRARKIKLTEAAALELLLTTSPTNPVATRATWTGYFG